MQIGFDIFLQTGQKNRIDIVFILAMVMNLKDKFSNETGLLDLNENKQLNRNIFFDVNHHCFSVKCDLGWLVD